ncbi:hybrid sensor histidine kinase/response regulator [Variovorax sp. OV329]|uniref:hybrid sensor histidine kinase/response regulator n=1 Tax=Variovorax sp. OV329 TaxID=1882825 RepID=UPI0008F39E3D|nr:hybrid sensor histidine kinase/response regulator [Variovorax sp. OV329]SFM82316.1 Signal transduction histidine kinase [Variovorax sp. OV329]
MTQSTVPVTSAAEGQALAHSATAASTTTTTDDDRLAIQAELLRLSTQPSTTVLGIQFLLDCGVAALFAWQYSALMAGLWLALIALTTSWRALFPQRLPEVLSPAEVPGQLRTHTIRIGIYEGTQGLAGILLFHPSDPQAQLLLGLVMLGMTLSSVFSVSYVARTMQMGICLLLTPVILMGLAFGTPPMKVVAALGVAMLVMMGRLVAERSRKLEDSIAQRHNESTLRAQALAGLQAAQQAQAERLRFFSAANHDLRQPVMAIGLQAEVLQQQLREGAGAAQLQSTLAALGRAQAALEGLTQQLLEIGRIEAAADPLTPGPLALSPLLAEFARPAGNGQRVMVRCPAQAVAWGDPVALRRMVGNLVDNALKFSPQLRGRVLVAVRRRGALWRIEVRDNGIGIAAEDQERVFEDFEQVGNLERNLRRGHGLGLAIVRRLAQRLDTQIDLRSAPGRGSVFAFTLPAAPQDAPGSRAAPASAPAPLGRLQATAPVSHLRPGLSVLVVEDNAVVAEGLAAILRQWSARPRVYASADELLKNGADDLHGVDLALCDIRLPGHTDGVTLAKRLQHQMPGLSIALVSADIDEATSALARERGWHALRKPVQPGALRAVLAAASATG